MSNEQPEWLDDSPDPDEVGGANFWQWSEMGPDEVLEGDMMALPIRGPEHASVPDDGTGDPKAQSDRSRIEWPAQTDTEDDLIVPVSSKGLESQVKAVWDRLAPGVGFRIEVTEYDEAEERPQAYQLYVLDDGAWVAAPTGDD